MYKHAIAAIAALISLGALAQDAPLPEADAPVFTAPGEQPAPPAAQGEAEPQTPEAGDASDAQEPPVPARGNPKRIIARVGDFTITEAEFQHDVMMRWLAVGGAAARQQPPSNEFKRRALNDMIDARILRILAQNSGIEVPHEEVMAQYEQGRKRLPSDDAFNKYITQLGVSPEGLLEEIRASIQVEKYREQETKNVTVTEEEVQEAYEKAKEAGHTRRNAPTADVGHILIMPESQEEVAWEQAKAKLEAARQRIVDGETFEDVAKDVSQDAVSANRGGLYREALPGVVGKEFSEQMMELPVNELSEPFRSSLGWHLIKVYARFEPGQVTYEQLAPVLRERLLAEKKQRAMAERIADARKIVRIELLRADQEETAE